MLDKMSPHMGMKTNHQIDWELIERLAEGLGVTYWARRKWRQRQHIPYKWRLHITIASKGSVKPEHFLFLDRRRSRNG
jgi:hypothetical protein